MLNDDVLKYSIKKAEKGWLAKVWEPAPRTEDRIRPFLWMVIRLTATQDEAAAIAKQIMDEAVVDESIAKRGIEFAMAKISITAITD
jgi:hypothetical protein